jgi:glycosyltransferase involved in cell wall biosynthesis
VRILLVQRSLSPPGGGNGVAAWMVHALARRHDVATITARAWSARETNAFYGTAIPEDGIAKHGVPRPWSWLAALPGDRASRLRMCSVLRYARPLADDYDLLITADNYGAFAKPGMQYLHFPVSLTPTPARLRPIVNLYFAFGDWLVGVPWSRARHNVTLANSRWTAAGLEQLQGVSARHVLYPPVIDPGDGLPWEQRSNTFLCIGRFHEVKRIEVAMSIVRRLRAHAMPDARLAIVGSPEDPGYHTRLYRFTARDRDWIDIREDLTRADLNALIGRCRYGLQAMEGEHFGMATAELARGGCLVFPHDSGGSPEVVDGEAALLWRTEDDAVARISAIARDAPLGAAVRWRLRRHARGFDSERFAEQFRTIVSEWAPT